MIPFKPAKFLSNNQLQTVYRVLFPPVNHLAGRENYEPVLLELSDGSGDRLWLDHNPPLTNRPPNGHYIILIHGMEGDSSSHYIVSTANEALKRGYGVIRMNMRNCGPGLGYATLPYNAGKTEDLQDVVNYVYKHLSRKILIAGFSLSANLVLKYFGENRRHKAIAFSAVSPPVDLLATCRHIDSPAAWLYKTRFLQTLKNKVRKGYLKINPDSVRQILRDKTFFSFDDKVTAPLSGFRDANEYYLKSSAKNFIGKIKHQGLVVYAKDDPLVPEKILQQVKWGQYPNLETVITDFGGHIGYIARKNHAIPDGEWLKHLILNYFDKHVT